MNLSPTLRLAGYLVVGLVAQRCLLASEPSTFTDLIGTSKQAQMKGQYGEAELLIKQAIAMLMPTDLRDSVMLRNELGQVHERQGRFAEAESDFRKALALNAEAKAPDESERAASLNNLGTIALFHGSLTEAQAQVQEAAAVLRGAGLTDSRASGQVLTNLCDIARNQEKFQEARTFCAEAERVILQAQGENSLDYAKLLVTRGLLSFQTGDFLDALDKGRKGLEIEKRSAFIPPLEKAIAESNLALVLIQLREFAESEKLLTDAAAIYKTEAVQKEDGLPNVLNSLATVHAKMNNLAAAEENAIAGLQVAKPDSDIAGRLHDSLGCTELRRKNWNAARKEFEQAMLIWQRLNLDRTPEFAAALTNLGTLYDRTGKHKQAESHYRAALAIDEARLGPEHPRVADDYANVAAQLYARKQFDEALALYQRSRTVRAKAYGPESAQVAETWRDTGLVNQAAERLDDAQVAYSNAVAAYKASNAAAGQDFSTCLREYAVVLRRLQRFHEAENADLQATRIQVTNAILADKAGHGEAAALSFH